MIKISARVEIVLDFYIDPGSLKYILKLYIHRQRNDLYIAPAPNWMGLARIQPKWAKDYGVSHHFYVVKAKGLHKAG